MIYEALIQYVIFDENENEKTKKERFIISDAQSFSDVESLLYENFGDYAGLDIPAIKRSKIKEIANDRNTSSDNVYIATLVDVFVDEEGEKKETKYLIAFYAEDIEHAYMFIRDYIQQGYNLNLVGLKVTKFIDVI